MRNLLVNAQPTRKYATTRGVSAQDIFVVPRHLAALTAMVRALYNLFEFLEQYELPRAKADTDVQIGDIVACYLPDSKKVNSLGTVQHVGRTTLVDDHPDGKSGDLFVLAHSKAKTKKNKALNGRSLKLCSQYKLIQPMLTIQTDSNYAHNTN